MVSAVTDQVWDMSLVRTGKREYPLMSVHIPVPITRKLLDAGYNRARITLTPDGILVRPYKGTHSNPKHTITVTLPDWSDDD